MGELLLNRRREVRVKSVLPHEVFGDSLQIDVRRALGHARNKPLTTEVTKIVEGWNPALYSVTTAFTRFRG